MINRATVAEQAYADIKARIVGGNLPAGRRLLPLDLAADLRVSPTPVKEALVRLERDGLVQTEARRGVVVRRFGEAETAQIYDVRRLVECHAVRRGFASGQVDNGFLAGLAADQASLLQALEDAAGQHYAAALEADRAFHARIAGLCGNPLLTDLHTRVMTQTHTVRAYTHAPHAAECLRTEHQAIVEAFRAGQPGPVLRALLRHLNRSEADLVGSVALPEPS